MRSARALARRARAAASCCALVVKPVLKAAGRGEAATWEAVLPLANAVVGLEREANALSERAREVFETVAKVEAAEEEEAPSTFPASSAEWEEWEAEACFRPADAQRREWAGWWRAGQWLRGGRDVVGG